MIRVDNKIKNIYYMLCYSFNGKELSERDEESLGEEAFDNIYNLFSLLMCMLLKKQIKKGIHKEYNNIIEPVKGIKGKINLTESINKNTIVNKSLVCNFDEFSENCLMNQVIKTTMYYLLKSNKIGNETKDILKRMSIYFDKIDLIDIKSIKWDSIRFNRNNVSYKYIIDICKLILGGLIVSDRKGNSKFKEFLDDSRVSSIYENFLKEYFRKHYPEFKAKSKILYFNENQNMMEYIPIMKTDVTLEYENRELIIDAKFYSKILRDNNAWNIGSKVVSSGNIYQILTYVDNQDPMKTGNVKGMLLYAQTIDEPTIMKRNQLNGHTIIIKTIDMNDEWTNIKNSLNEIATRFKNNEI